MTKQETTQEIGESIERHRRLEIGHDAKILAVGRTYCDVTGKLSPRGNGTKCLWLTNTSNERLLLQPKFL